jgi:cytoskeletal protein RodZ
VPPGRQRVGERHEASALFNINDLNAAAAARSRPQAAFDDKRSDIDDLLNLGGGMSGGFASAFEPPPIHAPAPPPPPKPVPVVAPAQPMSSALLAAQLEPPKKSRLGLVLGALVGVLLLGGAALAFVLTSDKAETTASNTATAADEKDEASEGKDDEAGEADEDQAAKDESADGGATETASDDKKDDTKSTDKATQSKTAAKDDKATATKDDKTATKDDKATTADKPAEDKPADDKAKPAAEFNRDAARSALAGAAGAASGCKTKNGPTGKGQVTVTFAPSGRATQATVGPPFAGTSVGSCAAAAFKSASVPPFSGSAVTVSKSFFIK